MCTTHRELNNWTVKFSAVLWGGDRRQGTPSDLEYVQGARAGGGEAQYSQRERDTCQSEVHKATCSKAQSQRLAGQEDRLASTG